ncbi:hypothetical protein ACWEGQ_11725 [Streptomyces seoulensis]
MPSATADTGVPDVTPPGQVTGVQAVGSTAGNNVRWTANADDTAHYEVWTRQSGQEEFTGPQVVLGSSWLDAAAPVGGDVEYRVNAVDTAGNVSPASVSAAAVRPAPAPVSAPQSVTAAPRDGSTPVTWAFPADAWKFHVYRRSDPNGAWTLLDEDPTGANRFEDTTAPAGVAYYYVASVDATGADSAPSATVMVDRLTPATATAPQAPVLSLKAPYAECTTNDCSGHGGAGQPVTITMSRPAGDSRVIDGYRWRVFGGGADSGYHQTSDSTVAWTPPRSGFYVAEVASVDVYGRAGAATQIEFKVA